MAGVVLAFKFINGQEVLAEVSSTPIPETGKVTLRKPCMLQSMQLPTGQIQHVFIPWTSFNPDIEYVDVPAALILISYPPVSAAERDYLSATSGIAVPQNTGSNIVQLKP